MKILKIIFINLVFISFIYPQNTFKKKFTEAEYLFLDEEYSNALPLYLALYNQDSTNANLNYKIGLCYLNLPEKTKSIFFLESAVKNITTKYKKRSYKLRSAPIEAYFFLGKAYHVNYKFKDAIRVFHDLKSMVPENDTKFHELINREIQMCENGIDLIKHPVNIIKINLGRGINTEYSEHSPVFSADESVFIFTSRRKGSTGEKMADDRQYYEDIYISYNIDGIWTRPINIGENINTSEHEATISLSPDGQILFIYKDEKNKGDGNIFFSKLNGDVWAKPVKLGKNINTKARETHASLSADGNTLYFTSNREGGYGGLDIYMSEKIKNKDNEWEWKWGAAQNLGPKINTPYNEEGPAIHPDGVTLFFSSEGHKTMGGYDIFFSTLNKDSSWTKPTNIGYPINSTEDDVFFMPTPDGKRIYYASRKAQDSKQTDIYLIIIITKEEKPISLVSGKVTSKSGEVPQNVEIAVTDANTSKIINICSPNSVTGKYLFVLVPDKKYYISFKSKGYIFHCEQLFIPKESSYQEIHKAIVLEPIILGRTQQIMEVTFETGVDTINNATELLLKDISETLNKSKELIVEIPVIEHNKLSEARFHSVSDNLVQKNVERERIKSKTVPYNPIYNNTLLFNLMDTTYVAMKEDEYLISFDINSSGELLYTNTDTLINDKSASLSVTERSKVEIAKLAQFLHQNEELGVEIIVTKADELSEKRSQFIIDVLVDEEGIERRRIKTKFIDEEETISTDIVELKIIDIPEEEKKEQEPLITGQFNEIFETTENNLNTVKETSEFSGKRITIQSIFFDFDKHSTIKYNDNLDKLAKYLKNNTKTKIEIRGYADSKGTKEYNYKLTLRRANFIKNYLSKKGAKKENFVIKSFGEDYPIALNENQEGRKLNRRVDIKILSPDKDIIVTKDIIIPRYLDLRYTVVLLKQKEKLSKDYFYQYEELNNVIPFEINDEYIYTIGNFVQRSDANEFLFLVTELGFSKANIIHKFELYKKESKIYVDRTNETKIYTIQLIALKNPVHISYFKEFDSVKKYTGSDKLHRYIFGEFKGISAAKEELKKIIKMGYPDAFIMNINRYKKQKI